MEEGEKEEERMNNRMSTSSDWRRKYFVILTLQVQDRIKILKLPFTCPSSDHANWSLMDVIKEDNLFHGWKKSKTGWQ